MQAVDQVQSGIERAGIKIQRPMQRCGRTVCVFHLSLGEALGIPKIRPPGTGGNRLVDKVESLAEAPRHHSQDAKQMQGFSMARRVGEDVAGECCGLHVLA